MTQSNRIGEPSTNFMVLEGVFKNRGGSPAVEVIPRSELCFPEVRDASSVTGDNMDAPNAFPSGAKCEEGGTKLGLNISLSVNSASEIPDTKSNSASVLKSKKRFKQSCKIQVICKI